MAMGKDVIIAKHGRKDNWSSNTVVLLYGVGPWKHISMLGLNSLMEFMSNLPGAGVYIKFWKD
uniref:Putative ovule protein n=1 Tax=Solanum chacoense TaxID=4108 RepID=A0A0V0ISS1_SOLCH